WVATPVNGLPIGSSSISSRTCWMSLGSSTFPLITTWFSGVASPTAIAELPEALRRRRSPLADHCDGELARGAGRRARCLDQVMTAGRNREVHDAGGAALSRTLVILREHIAGTIGEDQVRIELRRQADRERVAGVQRQTVEIRVAAGAV